MASTAQRWRTLADQLTARIDAVQPGQWEQPAPCAGWVARDVVAHLTGWMPALYLGALGREQPPVPSVDDDPAGAWRAVDAMVQGLLDDPAVAQQTTTTQAGTMTLEQLVAMTGLMDLLVHAWDLARATGQDERLDQAEVAGFAEGVASIDPGVDAAMRGSGHFGPRAPLAADADAQTRLLAFTGRRA